MQSHKPIENPSWTTRHRGPLLIHASKGVTREEFDSAMIFTINHCGYRGHFPRMDELERGGIVGAVRIVDCMRPTAIRRSQWHMEGQHGFLLRDARPLPFVPMAGRLGFLNVPADVVAPISASGGRTDGPLRTLPPFEYKFGPADSLVPIVDGGRDESRLPAIPGFRREVSDERPVAGLHGACFGGDGLVHGFFS